MENQDPPTVPSASTIRRSKGRQCPSPTSCPGEAPLKEMAGGGPAWIIHGPRVTYGEAGHNTQVWPYPSPSWETLWAQGPPLA